MSYVEGKLLRNVQRKDRLPNERPTCAEHDHRAPHTTSIQLREHVPNDRLTSKSHQDLGRLRSVEHTRARGDGEQRSVDKSSASVIRWTESNLFGALCHTTAGMENFARAQTALQILHRAANKERESREIERGYRSRCPHALCEPGLQRLECRVRTSAEVRVRILH